MTGISARAVHILALPLAVTATARAQARRLPAFDPERIFVLGDADLDGRLSLGEYRDLLRSSPCRRDDAAAIEPMFRRLDADGDGFLSLSEYRKSFPQRPDNAAERPAASDTKPARADEALGAVSTPSCADHAASVRICRLRPVSPHRRDPLRCEGTAGPWGSAVSPPHSWRRTRSTPRRHSAG
jgi:hypothetical protein